MSPDVRHTPAGGSPPRPVPSIGDLVEVVKLPDNHAPSLKIGQTGRVVEKQEAMYCVEFWWGWQRLTVLQIELREGLSDLSVTYLT